MDTLISDIVHEILLKLDSVSISCFAQTCSTFNKHCKSEKLWFILVKRDFDPSFTKLENINWFTVYLMYSQKVYLAVYSEYDESGEKDIEMFPTKIKAASYLYSKFEDSVTDFVNIDEIDTSDLLPEFLEIKYIRKKYFDDDTGDFDDDTEAGDDYGYDPYNFYNKSQRKVPPLGMSRYEFENLKDVMTELGISQSNPGFKQQLEILKCRLKEKAIMKLCNGETYESRYDNKSYILEKRMLNLEKNTILKDMI